jgi:PPOX class probable FMN-dependent enzyme
MTESTDDRITDLDTLHAHYGEPVAMAVKCEFDRLDEHHRFFIRHSPFLCLAGAGKDGQPSVSPKGDAPGFVKVLDEKHLLLPDRIGNKKVETYEHLLENPKVALVFLVPGIREVLRVWGSAEIRRDPELLDQVRGRGKRPPAVLVIKVTKAYFHCGKSIIRSDLWNPEIQANAVKFPPFGRVIRDQAQVAESTEALQADMDRRYQELLY